MVYNYQCDCGIRFEAPSSMKDSTLPKVCPGCKQLAPRMLPANVAGTFEVKTEGMAPQNTGVHQLDTNADRVIGRDSATKWNGIVSHYKDKERFMRNNEAGRADISRNPDGSYRVLKPEEKAVHERALTINKKAMDAMGTVSTHVPSKPQ